MKTRSEIVTDCIARAARKVDSKLKGEWPEDPEALCDLMGWSPGYARRVHTEARRQGFVGKPPRDAENRRRMAESAAILRDEYAWQWQKIADTLGFSSREAATMAVRRLKAKRSKNA